MALIRSPLSTFRRDHRGTSALEFALLAPVFLLLTMGMIAYSIYFGAAHSLQQIAADAARTAIAGLDEAERTALASGFITRNAGRYSFVDADKLSLDIRDDEDDASQFVVALSYEARELPIWNLFVGLALPDVTIERRSTIRHGGI